MSFWDWLKSIFSPAVAPAAPVTVQSTFFGTDYLDAANVIAGFESFSANAYWDVNAYRIGYGSDTEGPLQVKVVKGMVTTKERALQNLQLRIPQFERTIVAQVTAPSWQRIPTKAKSALLSFAYNYGDLTSTLASLVRGKASLDLIANAVASRDVDNAFANKNRRLAEAKIILDVA